MYHSLLLSSNYEFLKFVSEKKTLRLYFKGKVDVLAEWDYYIQWGSGEIKYPAIIKMKYPTRRFRREPFAHRGFIFRRDGWLCQYCKKALTSEDATIDHILPKCRGGTDNWENMVTACFTCNTIIKGDKTPEEVGLKLIKEPVRPKNKIFSDVFPKKFHKEWDYYLGGKLL